MSYETVIWEQSDGVGRLTLNRPETLNAWTAAFGEELLQVVTGEAADDSVRAVLVTGAGRGFSSGADLKAGFDPHPDDGMPDVKKELHNVYHPVIAGIRRLPKPVVAAVNGPAVGIGASLAFACDLVLAAESAYFGLAFVNIGLMPDGGSTLFVPTAVGKARAFQMALLGERVCVRAAGGPAFLGVDIDVADPSVAPGTGTPEVAGLLAAELIALLRALAGLAFVGFDVVEVCPPYDSPGQITSLLAANVAYEMLALSAIGKMA